MSNPLMDSAIVDLLSDKDNRTTKLYRLGIADKYLFELGGRDYLHRLCGLDADSLVQRIEKLFASKRE
jgi:transketolase C-terminal domain/subunit